MLKTIDGTAGRVVVDGSVAAAREFVDRSGASVLHVMRLAVGEEGEASALRLVGLFAAPHEPRRQQVAEAVRELRAALEEVPVQVEPRAPVTRADNIAELDGSVCWHLARLCELEARLS